MKTKLQTTMFLFIFSLVASSAQKINPATGLPDDGSPQPKIDPATGLPKTSSDLQKHLQDAEILMNQGQYNDALTNLVWYFNHSQFDQSQTGIRLSSALNDWVELGRRYPRAKQALLDIKDADTKQFLGGGGYFDLFTELNAINQYLGDDNATLAVFKSIENRDPQLAGECYFVVESQLVQKGEYETCRKYMGDPEFRFQSAYNLYHMGVENQNRTAEMHQKTMQQIQEINRQHGWTNLPAVTLPDNSQMFQKMTQDRFVGQVRQLIEILVGTGDKAAAEKIQREALAVLDDPRLETAVDDADARVIQQIHGAGTVQTKSN